MLRYYVIGIVVGFVLHLLVGFREMFLRVRVGEAVGHVAVYLMKCAIGGLLWPGLILQGAAHVFMVMAVKVCARRESKAYERAIAERAAEIRAEPEMEWRKAA